jgi:hypothetical protein
MSAIANNTAPATEAKKNKRKRNPEKNSGKPPTDDVFQEGSDTEQSMPARKPRLASITIPAQATTRENEHPPGTPGTKRRD